MSDIYQQIWDADQQGNGVEAILDGSSGDQKRGYVKVAQGSGPDFKIISEVHIPPQKQKTYDLVTQIFDNYALDERDQEIETPEEREEIHNLLQVLVDTPPMQVARNYVSDATGTAISTERWYATLLEMWFRTFSQGGDPALSGFEHVFVGEKEGQKLQGYHFWYKYWLDDGLAGTIDRNRFPGLANDRIQYGRSQAGPGQKAFPESITLSYSWDAPDYDNKKIVKTSKPKGGFFVGCSVEGLMAMGTVAAHVGAQAQKTAIIHGARYDLKIFLSGDKRHVRTFYPVFRGPASSLPPVPPHDTPRFRMGALKILAAMVNPGGDDPGKETVILQNMTPGPISLNGWSLVDKMKKQYSIPEQSLTGGSAVTITLPGKNNIQLSNNGGEIRLLDPDGNIAHIVQYSKAQAKREGETIVF